MTAINKLTQKTTVSDADLVPIWDSESSRARSITIQTLRCYMPETSVVVTDISVNGGIMTVFYSNGTTKDVTL